MNRKSTGLQSTVWTTVRWGTEVLTWELSLIAHFSAVSPRTLNLVSSAMDPWTSLQEVCPSVIACALLAFLPQHKLQEALTSSEWHAWTQGHCRCRIKCVDWMANRLMSSMCLIEEAPREICSFKKEQSYPQERAEMLSLLCKSKIIWFLFCKRFLHFSKDTKFDQIP